MLLCKADLTLEQTWRRFGDGGDEHDGNRDGNSLESRWPSTDEDVVHRCRDWSQVQTFVEGNMRETGFTVPTD